MFGSGFIGNTRDVPQQPSTPEALSELCGEYLRILGTWQFPAVSTSVRAARHSVAESLAPHTFAAAEDAVLVVSELVTNSVVHAASTVTVTLELWERAFRLVVDDVHPDVPELSDVDVDVDVDADSGRGLGIIEAVALAWGSETNNTGKRLWAAFATHSY